MLRQKPMAFGRTRPNARSGLWAGTKLHSRSKNTLPHEQRVPQRGPKAISCVGRGVFRVLVAHYCDLPFACARHSVALAQFALHPPLAFNPRDRGTHLPLLRPELRELQLRAFPRV